MSELIQILKNHMEKLPPWIKPFLTDDEARRRLNYYQPGTVELIQWVADLTTYIAVYTDKEKGD